MTYQQPQWHPGQEVIIREFLPRGGHRDKTGHITRVGRRYIYAEVHGREQAAHADTGYEKSDYTASFRIATPEILAQEDRREAAVSRVVVGTRNLNWYGSLSVEALEAIADILEGEQR